MNLHDKDLPVIDPATIDEARLQMVAELHRAVYGDVWARPESPATVWRDLLHRIKAARVLTDDLYAHLDGLGVEGDADIDAVLARYVLARYREARR